DFYAALAAAYSGLGRLDDAARAHLEGAMLDDNPNALAALQAAYARLPGGACALTSAGGGAKLNLDCQRLPADLCPGAQDLSRAFVEARQAAEAKELPTRYGCR